MRLWELGLVELVTVMIVRMVVMVVGGGGGTGSGGGVEGRFPSAFGVGPRPPPGPPAVGPEWEVTSFPCGGRSSRSLSTPPDFVAYLCPIGSDRLERPGSRSSPPPSFPACSRVRSGAVAVRFPAAQTAAERTYSVRLWELGCGRGGWC